jgi:HEAT repeat protein
MAKKTSKTKATKKAGSKRAAKRSSKPAELSPKIGLRALASSETPVKQRVQAMASLANSVRKDEKSFGTAIKLLTDVSQPSAVRLAALQALQAASFSVLSFEEHQPDYLAALHKVMDDPDLELRQRTLGILSRRKDPKAQKRLIEGLRKPERALVAPEKSLQLLGYDIHADAYAAAREIVKNPPNPAAKREALRLLSSDADSAPLLEKVLRDKDEFAEIRQVSAAALNSLDPKRLQKNAREIVMDDSEYPEIQATSLTAINQFGTTEAGSDPNLQQQVAKLEVSDSNLLKKSARAFLSKYGG